VPRRKTAASARNSNHSAVPPLPQDALRWRYDPKKLSFESTAEVEPAKSIVGQDDALESLRFGLRTDAPGQNIYVRGLSGTGRLTLVRRVIEDVRLSCPLVKDCCYVANFEQPDEPRLITLPAGDGRAFRRRIDRLIDFISDDLAGALSSDQVQQRRLALEQSAERELEQIVKPFEQALQQSGLMLVRLQAGPVVQTTIQPVIDGKPVPPEAFEQLHNEGKVTDDHYQTVRQNYEQFEQQLAEIGEQVGEIHRVLNEELQGLLSGAARLLLAEYVRPINEEFPAKSVSRFLTEVIDDVVTNQLGELEKDPSFTELYRVNLLSEQQDDSTCPIIIENAPNMRNLLGTIDYQTRGDDVAVSHMGIRAGSLLRADGGYLILEARDVLSEPGAWRALTRALLHHCIEIRPAETGMLVMGPSLKPEPVEIHVKVILLGDDETYYLLDAYDPDFGQLFKVLADFDSVMPRTDESVQRYAGVLARIASEEQLPPFDRSAVAAWAEHGARIAARRNRLTTRFGRLADIAREAAFVAREDSRSRVTGDDMHAAVKRAKRRADLPSRRFREYIADGTIRIDTRGSIVGQVNGLAVLQAGPLMYGFPCRISATIGPGTSGVINIERESALSGAIHTKGFYILGGLLRYLLRTDHPLAFEASIAFEQSYGGIDGDSASGAEVCCLLSALTDMPLRQDLAMTGAIDQHGHVQAIGAVNEKIEGFFDACADAGLTGSQGVIIPKANAGDLMLRGDVVTACNEGRFAVYAVERIHQALELFTGIPAGYREGNEPYAADTLLHTAVERAKQFWDKVARSPGLRRARSTKP
jgi:predicted ATP-dependent protease